MREISELLPPLPKPARFDYDHEADMGTPVYSEAQVRKYALDTIRRAEARQAPRLAQNVIDLVIAAREFWDVHNDLSEESNALDKALERFSEQVPYENGPPAPLPAGTVTEEMWKAYYDAVDERPLIFSVWKAGIEAAFAARPAETVASDLVRRLNAAADGIEDVNFDRLSRRRGYKNILREAAAALLSTPQPAGEAVGARYSIEHDGFVGTAIGHYQRLDGKRGVVLQQDGTNVCHLYGEKWLKPAPEATPPVPGVVEALREIVDFCDDPDGSEKPESLALGLSRLLPAARDALAYIDEVKG